jgi:hypothetical protein
MRNAPAGPLLDQFELRERAEVDHVAGIEQAGFHLPQHIGAAGHELDVGPVKRAVASLKRIWKH